MSLFAAADAVRNDMIGQLLEKRQNHDTRELNKAMNEFRMLHQQPDSRREFDLYDPDYLKKDKPARVSDQDPRCGIASLQKFEGEDLNSKARKKYQAEQTREWAEQQMREKEQAEKNQKAADRLYELKMRELDQRSMDLADAEAQCRRAIDTATSDYNKALVSCGFFLPGRFIFLITSFSFSYSKENRKRKMRSRNSKIWMIMRQKWPTIFTEISSQRTQQSLRALSVRIVSSQIAGRG